MRNSLWVKRLVIDLTVTNRHFVVGTHRLRDVTLDQTSWLVRDVEGAQLGTVSLIGNTLVGLAEVLVASSVEVGENVSITLGVDENEATLIRIEEL